MPTLRCNAMSGTFCSDVRKTEDEPDYLDGISIGTGSANNWQAMVMLKMNMSRLDIEMNMSNVMGTTVLSCNTLSSTGKLMFHSNGDRVSNRFMTILEFICFICPFCSFQAYPKHFPRRLIPREKLF